MKRSMFKSLCVLVLCVAFFSCTAQKNFVKVTNTHFTVNKKPYYFVGANFWYGAYLGADADYGNRERLIRELDQLQKSGVKNLRIVAASEESDFGLPLSPPFQYKNGGYNETLLKGLDFLLTEMRKRDMRAVMVLNNYWDWTGGMGQYVSWTTNLPVIDPSVNKNQTWDEFMKTSATFYTIEKAQQLYRRYINMLVNRVNSYTKKVYKNDPTIMTWELANEPRPSNAGNLDENIKIFTKWVDETATYIHSIDPKHLVTTGSEGSKGTLNSLDYTLQAHESKYIDYMTIHLWPKNWGWYKADNPETIEITKENAAKYIAEHIEISRKLNKPCVIEEFGFVRDREVFSPDSPVTARDNFYGFILKLVQDSIQAESPLAGLNFWGWGGEGRAQQSDYMWKPGDISYTADPYSEAQGLNSIYNTDKSTLDIISKVALELEKLSKSPNKKSLLND